MVRGADSSLWVGKPTIAGHAPGDAFAPIAAICPIAHIVRSLPGATLDALILYLQRLPDGGRLARTRQKGPAQAPRQPGGIWNDAKSARVRDRGSGAGGNSRRRAGLGPKIGRHPQDV